MKIVLKIEGMTCDACVRAVARKLSRVPGVASATVELASGLATVELLESAGGPAALVGAVEKIGYRAAVA